MLRALFLSAALIPAIASAADSENLSGEVSLNGSRSTGNTDTTDVGGVVKLKWAGLGWRQKLRANADYAEQSGNETKSRYRISYAVERDLSDRWYANASTDYFQDDFGPYKSGIFVGAGLGYNAVLPPPFELNLEAGPGYRRQKTREPVDVPPGIPSLIEEELAVRLAADADWTVNERITLTNDSELITSASDTYIWNETAITANLFGGLGLRASYRVDHHTDVPEDREKTDTVTRIGVVYTFGD